MFSYTAFLLACHNAQSVTIVLIDSSHGREEMTAASHALGFCSWILHKCSAVSSFAKAQTHLAILHSSRECFQESGLPHIKQLACSAICRRWSTSVVGIECLANPHKNTLILEGTLSFQMADHSRSSASTSEHPGLFCNHAVTFSCL